MRDELVELLKNCKTEEEAKKILEGQNIELTEEELEEISGGTGLCIIPTFVPIRCC